MKKSRYTEEQVIGAVKQMEAGRKAKELARELGVSAATLYAWKSKYGGLEVNEARRLSDLEQENARLKKRVLSATLREVVDRFDWACDQLVLVSA